MVLMHNAVSSSEEGLQWLQSLSNQTATSVCPQYKTKFSDRLYREYICIPEWKVSAEKALTAAELYIFSCEARLNIPVLCPLHVYLTICINCNKQTECMFTLRLLQLRINYWSASIATNKQNACSYYDYCNYINEFSTRFNFPLSSLSLCLKGR